MSESYSLFAASFVTFFVLIDAIGVSPIFVTLTAQGDPAWRRKTAIKAVVVATIIVFAFAIGGSALLHHMGISIDAFRIAGGMLLLLIAIEMVFDKRTAKREKRVESALGNSASDKNKLELDDVSVFPLGIPMLAGPGTIATAMLYMSKSDQVLSKVIVLSAVGLNMALALVILVVAGPITRVLGDSFTAALTRILGVILAALSVQLMIDGLKGAFGW